MGPLVLIFDADNTVVRQGAPLTEFAEQVNRTIDRFEALPAVDQVIVLSNGPPRGRRAHDPPRQQTLD